MEWKKAVVENDKTVKIPERWLHLYYYEALNVLFRFENSLRVFVYTVLKDELQEKWQEAALSGGGCIKSETKKRISQNNDYGYLGYDVSSPMLFLNSGDLIDVIVSDAYWKYFAKYFKASKSIVITKLQEIGTVRNALAHFRPIKEDDLDLVKQNTKHVLMEVEKALVKITSISSIVPTNNSESWYVKLKSIISNNLFISLYHSDDERWIRINFSYNIPVFELNKISDEFYSYKVGNLRTVEILRNFPAVKNNCIFLSEYQSYGSIDSDFSIKCSKSFSVVISKKTLIENLDSINNSIRDIASKVDEETELLESDNLARGILIESKHAYSQIRNGHNDSKYWHISLDNLNPDTTDVSEVEYWGTRGNYITDFVSATSQYPWMPSTISGSEPPF